MYAVDGKDEPGQSDSFKEYASDPGRHLTRYRFAQHALTSDKQKLMKEQGRIKRV